MKKNLRHVAFIAGAVLFLSSCNTNTGSETEEVKDLKTEKKENKSKELTLDQKARNTLQNTTVIFTGAMMISMNKMVIGQLQGMSVAFKSEMTDEKIKEIDEQIAGLGETNMQPLDELMKQMDNAFDELEKENMSVYKKIFLHDVMKEGIEITEKHNLPKGFPPLSQNLSNEEIKRYIIRTVTEGNNSEDPVMKMYTELFQWIQKLNTELGNDPEYKSFMASLQEK